MQFDRLRYVTAHYAQLQGLRLLPLSVPCFVAAWWDLMPQMRPSVVSLQRIEVTLVALAIAASFPIRAYYERRFGHVPPSRPSREGLLLLGGVVALICLEWARELAGWRLPLPLVCVTIGLTRLGLVAHRVRRHYLWIAAACLLFLGFSLLHVPAPILATSFDVLLGGGFVIAAIGDHLLLQRALAGAFAR